MTSRAETGDRGKGNTVNVTRKVVQCSYREQRELAQRATRLVFRA